MMNEHDKDTRVVIKYDEDEAADRCKRAVATDIQRRQDRTQLIAGLGLGATMAAAVAGFGRYQDDFEHRPANWVKPKKRANPKRDQQKAAKQARKKNRK